MNNAKKNIVNTMLIMALVGMSAAFNCHAAASDGESSLDRNELMQLGVIAYKTGEIELAIKCTQLAADQGSLLALYNLAGIHEVEGNLKKAVDLYMQAAERGDVLSCIHILYFMHTDSIDYSAIIASNCIVHIYNNPNETQNYIDTFPDRWSIVKQALESAQEIEDAQEAAFFDDHVGTLEEVVEPEEQDVNDE